MVPDAIIRLPLTALLGALALSACGEPAPALPALSAADVARAEEVYADGGCGICHGEQGQGVPDAGPGLVGLAPYWTAERLSDYLGDPAAFVEANPDFDERRQEAFDLEMPAFEHVPEEDRRLLARWLLTR